MPSFTAARRGRSRPAPAQRPITPGQQLCEDTFTAIGPAVAVIDLVVALHRAGVISRAWSLYPDLLIAVPFAVIIWHLAAKPAPTPPASTGRLVIVRGAAMAVLLFTAASIAVALVFLGHATWVGVVVPICYALVPLMHARAADQRNRARPPTAVAARRAAGSPT
jgi:predicted small integral membrane protein